MPAPEKLPDPAELWCLGLPCVGDEPLDPLEVSDLRAHTRRMLWRCVGLGLAIPVIPLAALLLAGLIFGSSWFLGLAAMLVLLLGIPVGLLLLNDAVGERRDLIRDVDSGRALVFEGTLLDQSEDRDTRRELQAAGILTADPREVQRLRVLQHCQRVLGNGRDRASLQRVDLQSAAAPPAYALRAQLGPDLVVVNRPERVSFTQRRLTDRELAEIHGYVRRLRRPDGYLWFGFAFLGLSLTGLIGGYRYGDLARAPASEWIAAGVMLVLGVLSVRTYGQRLSLAHRFRLDQAAGRAVAALGLTHPVVHPRGYQPADGDEFLPLSGVLWTISGRPADWRSANRPL